MNVFNSSFKITLRAPVVALAILAASSIAQAGTTVIVDDLADTLTGSEGVGSRRLKAESFSTTITGTLSLVELDLNFNKSAVTDGAVLDISLYDTDGSGLPTTDLGVIGTITATVKGATVYTVSGLVADTLTAGDDYAIEIDEGSLAAGDTVSWEFAAAGDTNAGTGGLFFNPGANNNNGTNGWTNTGATLQQRLLKVDVVPEPASVAMLLGLGGLGFAALRRRKARSA